MLDPFTVIHFQPACARPQGRGTICYEAGLAYFRRWTKLWINGCCLEASGWASMEIVVEQCCWSSVLRGLVKNGVRFLR